MNHSSDDPLRCIDDDDVSSELFLSSTTPDALRAIVGQKCGSTRFDRIRGKSGQQQLDDEEETVLSSTLGRLGEGSESTERSTDQIANLHERTGRTTERIRRGAQRIDRTERTTGLALLFRHNATLETHNEEIQFARDHQTHERHQLRSRSRAPTTTDGKSRTNRTVRQSRGGVTETLSDEVFLADLRRRRKIKQNKNMERFTILRVILAQGPC